MKIFIAVVAIIASFSVNANEAYGSYNDDPKKSFNASDINHETMNVTWKRIKNKEVLKTTCNSEFTKRGLKTVNEPMNGCTFWTKRECIIYTTERTTMWTLGHEARHCFQGAWH